VTKRFRIGVNLLCFGNDGLGGTWTFSRRLFESMQASDQLEFVFFCRNDFELERWLRIPEGGIKYERRGVSIGGRKWMRVLYEQTVLPFAAEGIDLMFSPYVGNPLFHPRFRTNTTIHDLTPFYVPKKYGRVQGLYVRLMTRLLLIASNKIITVSESSRSDLVERMRTSREKISVVFNMTDRSVGGVPRFGKYFLFVGTLQPAKNLEGTLRAFARFHERYDVSGHELVVVGADGWGNLRLSSLVEELGIRDCVQFRGYVTDEQLQDLYLGCKALVLLSLYEGFGIPPLEALKYGKPSIVSNVSSLPEVVGKTGIKVDPLDAEAAASAMREIAEAPEKYLCGRGAQLRKFAPEAQVRRFFNVLTEVCNSRE